MEAELALTGKYGDLITLQMGESPLMKIRPRLADLGGLLGGGAIALFVAILTVYRARHLDITLDEAFTYNSYLSGRFSQVFDYRFNNNHVLYTLLSFPLIRAFGTSEFVLRLPALMAALAYLALAMLICRRLFRSVWIAVGMGLLCLNPIIGDYLTAARGYGLALAWFMGALFVALRCLDELAQQTPFSSANRRRAICVSICMSLAVCANFTFVIPCFAMALVLAFLLTGGRLARIDARPLLVRLIAPGAILGVAMLWPFLLQVRPYQFIAGATTIWGSIEEILSGSLFYRATATTAYFQPALSPLLSHLLAAAGVLVSIVLCFLFAVVFVVGRQLVAKSAPDLERIRFVLIGATLCCSIALSMVLHLALRMLLPIERTGIYLIPLTTLSIMQWGLMSAGVIATSIRRALLALAVIVVMGVYALQVQTQFMYYARYNAGMRTAFELIDRDRSLALSSGAEQPVRVGGSWLYQASIDFYRSMFKAKWLAEFDGGEPAHRPAQGIFPADEPQARPAGHDYFLFRPSDYPELDYRELNILWTDPVSGTSLARVKKPATQSVDGTRIN